MKADALLSRLEKVKSSAGGWVACCPAHEDKSPSLAIKETEDGRVLVHCFAGCSVESIINSLGLEFDALFPDKPPTEHRVKGSQRPFPAHNVLAALRSDSLFVAVCAGNLAKGVELSDVERAKLMAAASRIQEGARLALGQR